MYPKKIQLKKIYTLPDAEYPQPDKYPNGTVREGLMWKHTRPQLGEKFHVMESKMHSKFITSEITKIVSATDKRIIFNTLNSKYELTILD